MNPDALRAVKMKLPAEDGKFRDIYLLVTHDNVLHSVSDPGALAAWLPTLPAMKTANQPNPVQIDDVTKRDIKFFGTGPCWFGGCDELRVEYQAELQKLEAANCKSCERGALIRKYLKLIAAAQVG